jgi:hypothetical protein
VEKRLLIILLLCTSYVLAGAQNISGFWKGTLTIGRACFPVNNLEVQLTVKGDSVFGSTYHYLDVDNYIKKSAEGKYNAATKRLTLEELLIVTYHIPNRCVICMKNYTLQYSRQGNTEMLIGTWTGHILGTDSACGPGTIELSRIKESAFKEVPEITVDTGSIRLDIYDNGVIDNDTISVRVNKQQVLSNQRLSARPITVNLRIDAQNPFQEIELVAENLGGIPPNTALLIITAGEKRYRLDVSSTETKSARIRFVYKGGVLQKE